VSCDMNTTRPPAPAVWPRALATASVLATLAVLAGCVQPAPPTVSGGGTVQLQIARGREGGTLAFVPVYINGQGPYAFALDTGASHSVVDVEIADELGLPRDGRDVEMSGVAAQEEAEPVKVGNWQVGDVKLPTDMIVAIQLSGPMKGGGLQGLLGSDVLSRFGTITVDYTQSVLVLNPAAEQAGGQPSVEQPPAEQPKAKQKGGKKAGGKQKGAKQSGGKEPGGNGSG
jgi:predicted aspartyl protease